MKKLYSIGETAKIIGISTQTLRSYSNMKLVEPEEINLETGYRYYSFNQLHYLDRIKYLRQLGLALKDIADILKDGKPEKMLYYLEQKKQDLGNQIVELNKKIGDVDWYINYFKQLQEIHIPRVPYIKKIEKRYIIYVPYKLCNYSKDILSQENKEYLETEMMSLKNNLPYAHRRQWGLKIDFQQYLNKKYKPKAFFLVLNEKPPKWNSEYMDIIPAGLYLCLWCREKLAIENSLVKEFYASHTNPLYAYALEYENSFTDYTKCPYEYQSLIQEIKKD